MEIILFLSNDYSPFGKFSIQILVLTIIFVCIGVIPVIFGLTQKNAFFIISGFGIMGSGITFFIWGNWKQDKELVR